MLLAFALLSLPQSPAPDSTYDSYLAHIAAAESSLRLSDLEGFRRWLDRAPAGHRGWEWRWLDSLRDQSIANIPGETPLGALAVSRDGSRLAVGDDAGVLVVREAGTGRELHRIGAHDAEISSLAFDAAGERIVTASHDRKAKIFDARTGAQILEFTRHGFPLGGAAFSPDGTLVASVSYERPPGTVVGTAHVWNAATGEVVKTLEGGQKPLVGVAFSPDGRTLAAGSWHFCVFLWDLEKGGEPRKLAMPDEGKYNAVDSVAFSPDGRRVVGASKDDTARVWDVATGEVVVALRGHGNYVASAAFTPDGARIATASVDQTVRIWDAGSGECTAVLRAPADAVRSVAFAPDGESLWAACEDGALWQFHSDPALYGAATLETSAAAYVCVHSPDGSRLATCSYDGRIQLWDTHSLEPLAAWQAHPKASSCHILAFSPDGARLYSGSYDKTIAIWDPVTLAELGRMDLEGGAYVGRLSPRGDVFAVAQTNRRVALWDVEGPAQRQLLPPRVGSVHDLAFSPDGRHIAVAGDDGVSILLVADAAEVAVLDSKGARSVAFAPDGRSLYVGSDRIAEYATDGWKLSRTMDAGRSSASRLSIDPTGTLLAIGSRDAVLLDLARGEIRLTLRTHREAMWFLEWSPDGSRLATAAMDGTVAIADPRPVRVRAAERQAAREESQKAAAWVEARIASGVVPGVLANELRADAGLSVADRAARLAAVTRHVGSRLPSAAPAKKTGTEAGGGR